MGLRKVILLKIQYFHVLTISLGRKFHSDSKIILKLSEQYQKGINILIEL